MADSKENVGAPDLSRVSGSEDDEVRFFAERHGISADQMRDMIAEFGNDRATLDRVAAGRKRT